jgi:hypothetical protein
MKADGGITAAVYIRYTLLGLDRRGFGQVVVDSFAISPKEQAALAPAKAKAGAEWGVPEAVVRRFHRVLSPQSDQSTLARPGELTAAKLAGRVTAVRGGVAYVSYSGRLAAVHQHPFDKRKDQKARAEVSLTGAGAYEVKTGRLLSFTFVGDGTYRHWPPYDKPARYGAVVEWRRQRP